MSWLQPIHQNIPEELRNLPQWVVWKAVKRDGKWTKIPHDAKSGKKAKSDDPATWAPFFDAYDAYAQSGKYAGIGFVLSADDPYCGWDLDHCHDQENGLEPWAESIVKSLESYSEVSPSGTGIRIICKAELPPEGRKKGRVEVYQEGRFLTITGHWLNQRYFDVSMRQNAVIALHTKVFGNGYKPGADHGGAFSAPQDDAEILEKAFSSKNGERIRALYNGDASAYNSQSEADSALCYYLAFWLDRDAARIDAVFRQSGLMRDKWDKKHYSNGKTYGQGTIEDAIAGTSETYRGRTDQNSGQQSAGAEDGDGKKKKKPSMADALVNLVPDAALFHDDDAAFCDIYRNGHRGTMPVRSKAFRNWLSHQAFTAFKKSPSSQAMQDALSTICGKALFQGPERKVHVRIGGHKGCIYLDLGRESWDAVEITPEGWQTIQDPEIRFWRPRGLRPLPIPEPGGSVSQLRPLLNIKSDRDFKLVVGWLLSALRPKGPYPIIVFSGEQGTGKSTAGRILRQILDPNIANLRTTARTEQDLVIAARNGWIIALDNLSGVKTWLSDAMCRIATGGGFGTRELYTDADEVLIEVQRPISINGIDDLCTRNDLADRSFVVELSVIPTAARVTERELNRRLASANPEILGGLLDAVVSGLRHEENIQLKSLPRMADAAIWWSACERGGSLPWGEGGILEAFQGSRESIIESYVESDEVASTVVSLIENQVDFAGTASELLAALENEMGDKKPSKFWPGTPKAMAGRIRRAASFLREYGIVVETARKHRGRIFYIKKDYMGNKQSQQSQQSQDKQSGLNNSNLERDCYDADRDRCDATDTDGHATDTQQTRGFSQENQIVNSDRDCRDHCDEKIHTQSDGYVNDDVETF